MPRSLGESLWTISYLRPKRFELFDEHFDDFAVFDLAHAEHVGAFAVVHLADDVGKVFELDVEPLFESNAWRSRA